MEAACFEVNIFNVVVNSTLLPTTLLAKDASCRNTELKMDLVFSTSQIGMKCIFHCRSSFVHHVMQTQYKSGISVLSGFIVGNSQAYSIFTSRDYIIVQLI
jgi:hypothetical protein